MSQRNDFIKFAISQVGVRGGNVVRKWYNEKVANIGNYNWPWCAAGISYCAHKVGIAENIIKPTASAPQMMRNFQGMNRFKKRGTYTPKAGDIIVFKWIYNTTSIASHVGIVENVKNNYVNTIEFNSGTLSDGAVTRCKYHIDNTVIVGYCVPDFKKSLITIKKDGYIRENAWIDPEYNTSKPLMKVTKGNKVKFLEDDNYGWSKVQKGSTIGYIQNSRLDKDDISKLPLTTLKKRKKLKMVRENNKKIIPANQKVIFICTIEKGKNKNKAIIRYKSKSYYVEMSNLNNLIKR